MRFAISEKIFLENFVEHEKFKHKLNQHIIIFPYVTNRENLKSVSFENIVGSFFRQLYSLKPVSSLEMDRVVNEISDKVRYNEKEDNRFIMHDILRQLYFSKGQLKQFDIRSYEQLSESSREASIAGVLVNTMANKNDIFSAVKTCNLRKISILDQLVLENLPELKSSNKSGTVYYNECPEFNEFFTEDLSYLIQKDISDVNAITNLFKFYYFTYISRTILRLNQRFAEADPTQEHLYYCVAWEKTGHNRKCFHEGWKKLEKVSGDLLTHAVLLEILNQNTNGFPYDYRDINDMLAEASVEERKEVYEIICKVEEDYTNKYFSDYLFKKTEYVECCDYDVICHINILFEHIKEIFTGRLKSPNNRFAKGYIEFAKNTFAKNRYSMGYMLELSEEYLLLLTKVVIKDKIKISLADLFHAFEQRGVYTDSNTRDKIVEYFEKLNIIEKKSDSGDAQYVIRFL